jgi:hypothetical protein
MQAKINYLVNFNHHHHHRKKNILQDHLVQANLNHPIKTNLKRIIKILKTYQILQMILH